MIQTPAGWSLATSIGEALQAMADRKEVRYTTTDAAARMSTRHTADDWTNTKGLRWQPVEDEDRFTFIIKNKHSFGPYTDSKQVPLGRIVRAKGDASRRETLINVTHGVTGQVVCINLLAANYWFRDFVFEDDGSPVGVLLP